MPSRTRDELSAVQLHTVPGYRILGGLLMELDACLPSEFLNGKRDRTPERGSILPLVIGVAPPLRCGLYPRATLCLTLTSKADMESSKSPYKTDD